MEVEEDGKEMEVDEEEEEMEVEQMVEEECRSDKFPVEPDDESSSSLPMMNFLLNQMINSQEDCKFMHTNRRTRVRTKNKHNQRRIF